MSDFRDKLIADKYRVGELILKDESGDFYHARHEIMDRPVTIKILPLALGMDARWSRAFIDEARAASAVTHANVLSINDFGTDAKNTTYAVFEQVDGKTLADDKSQRDEKTAIDIIRQLAGGTAAAHEKQFVYGNLKPQNIFLNGPDESPTAKLCSFGSDQAKLSRDDDPRYLAPEQLGDFPASDERSDIYSLGVMFYEMLSGEVPFDGETGADVLAKQNEPPPPLSAFRKDLNPEIEPIILSAIAADPERRYQTMSAFAEDIDTLASRVGAPPKADAAAATTSPRRNIWQTAFVVLAGVAILAAALIYATSTKRSDPTTNLQADADSMPVQPLGPATGAYEDGLMKIPDDMSPEQLMMTGLNTTIGADGLPGGDGYNPWAGTVLPPNGTPPTSVPPGGGQISGDVTGTSQFMPPTGSIEFVRKDLLTGVCSKIETREVVPCPDQSASKPLAVPPGQKPPTAKPTPTPKAEPSPAATDKPANTTTDKPKPQPSPKTPTRQSKPKTTKPASGESLD